MAYLQYGRNAMRKSTMHHPLLFAVQGVRYRKLEVILTTTIDKLGKAGETVKVAPGFFRNHLMPKLLAVPNIDKFAHLIHEQRKIYQPTEVEAVKVVVKNDETNTKEYEAAAKRLAKTRVNIRKFIIEGKGDELREPVTKEEVLAEIARQLQVHIEPENLHLPTPLSTLGEHKVPLRLPKSIPKPAGEDWILNIKIRKR
ncbi:50S ribosomal protein L9-like [Salvia divinorum]|uniref:Large ribosomal subunit protein bL9c n=1 Tax=Salvia divinorum TaxID=28513 RepID=A0ABD1H2M7_SALDI